MFAAANVTKQGGQPMQSKYLNRSQYANFIACVASRHGCKLVGVDFEKRIIDIEGARDAVQSCFATLERLLGRHQPETRAA